MKTATLWGWCPFCQEMTLQNRFGCVEKHSGQMEARMDEEWLYEDFECPECGWRGEGKDLTVDGECPDCYALLHVEGE